LTSKLFICGNHLGNIKDLPPRTKEVLEFSDLILCEDTRSLSMLLSSLGIKNKKLLSYYDYNERTRTEHIKQRVQNEDLNIALISESGMPMVSDPGYHIINVFHELKCDMQVIPGPTACISALALSGFSLAEGFQFIGFWPKKKSKQTNLLTNLINNSLPIVFYESPKRILKTLEIILNFDNTIEIFIIKEISKRYERFWKGNIKDIHSKLCTESLKGEFSIVINKA
jgi:16S rRNA (cytidine1402-2'-O)-methyltransferase